MDVTTESSIGGEVKISVSSVAEEAEEDEDRLKTLNGEFGRVLHLGKDCDADAADGTLSRRDRSVVLISRIIQVCKKALDTFPNAGEEAKFGVKILTDFLLSENGKAFFLAHPFNLANYWGDFNKLV